MNLEENDNTSDSNGSGNKKLSRKEKKALKKDHKRARDEEKAAAKRETAEQEEAVEVPEETEVELEPAPVPEIPPPQYTTWEKISPPARRKRQIANMDEGFRQILGLVQSMRENQEVLMESYKKLPEAVDSVKKLADHSAQQSELLQNMNHQMGAEGSTGKFTETLASMDKTTQTLLERAQRSEERLYGMLRRAQRRIALMTLLVLLLFFGAVAGVLLIAFPEETKAWFSGGEAPPAVETPTAQPEPTATSVPTPEPAVSPEEPTSPGPAASTPAPVVLDTVVAPSPVDTELPVALPEDAEVAPPPAPTPVIPEPADVSVPPTPTPAPAPAPRTEEAQVDEAEPDIESDPESPTEKFETGDAPAETTEALP